MLIRRTEPHLHITVWCIFRFFEIKLLIYTLELNKNLHIHLVMCSKKNKIYMKHVRRFNENVETERLKIFIVLYCFWEGDGYLVNEYKDCFLTEEDAISFANTLKYGGKTIKIYLPGDTIPDESDGGYGTPAFVQIIEKVF